MTNVVPQIRISLLATEMLPFHPFPSHSTSPASQQQYHSDGNSRFRDRARTSHSTCLTDTSFSSTGSPSSSSSSSALSMARSSDLTDEEILAKGDLVYTFKSARQFCSASKRFRSCTRQWPWDWCSDDLSPQQWGATLIQDLAKLAETYTCNGKEVKEAKEHLQRAMRIRKSSDTKAIFLESCDINKVINDFRLQQSQNEPLPNSAELEDRKPPNIVSDERIETAAAETTTLEPTPMVESTAESRPMREARAPTAPTEIRTSIAPRRARALTAPIETPVESYLAPAIQLPSVQETTSDEEESVPHTSPTTTPDTEVETDPVLEATNGPEVDTTPETVSATEEPFPEATESRDIKPGLFWDNIFNPQPPTLMNKKRSGCCSTLPSAKRSRTITRAKRGSRSNTAETKPEHKLVERVSDTLDTMAKHSEVLLAQFYALSQKQHNLKYSDTSKTAPYSEQQGSVKLQNKMRCLRQSIQELENEGNGIRARAKSWYKIRDAVHLTDVERTRGFENISMQMKENEEAILTAERTLRQTMEAFEQQQAAIVEESRNRTMKELIDWHTMMKFVQGFPSSLHTVNTALKQQETSLEKLLDDADLSSPISSDRESISGIDVSGIDESLGKMADFPREQSLDPPDGLPSIDMSSLYG